MLQVKKITVFFGTGALLTEKSCVRFQQLRLASGQSPKFDAHHGLRQPTLPNFLLPFKTRSGHLGLEPSSTQLAHLLKEARSAGEFVQHPQLALRYTQLAAERGIRGAAAALAHAFATGQEHG